MQLLHKSPTDIVAKLEQAFKLDEDVIRHLTVAVDKNMLKARAGVKKRRRQRASRIERAETSNQEEEQRSSSGRNASGRDQDRR